MKNPLITMSAIVGRPDRNDIYSYLSSLKENGIEQALIYPRSGCEIPYLSEEWFLTISHFSILKTSAATTGALLQENTRPMSLTRRIGNGITTTTAPKLILQNGFTTYIDRPCAHTTRARRI